MNATDVERLVPHLGCHPDLLQGSNPKGRCIELLQNSFASGTPLNLSKELATACRGEADLCHDLKQGGRCQENDVICQLMHKVRNYLRTHYKDDQQDSKSGRPEKRKVGPLNLKLCR